MDDLKNHLASLQSPDASQRELAAVALGQLKAKEAVEPLLGLLDDPIATVRRAAINALRLIRDERISVPFIYMLNDEDDIIRRGVSAWFMTLRGDQTHLVPPLCDVMLAPDSRTSTREFAAMLLGKFGDKNAVDALHQAMEQYPRLQLRIAQTLRKMSDPRSVPVLLPCLQSDDLRLQKSAAKTLQAIGTPEAVAAVQAWKARRS